MSENMFPSEVIELPSQGWFYPENHPLATGKLEVYYMTAKHEDILSSKNLIQRGVVIDKLMESLIVDKRIKYDDLLVGDKNGLIVASRILGYGKEYSTTVTCPACNIASSQNINLEEIDNRELHTDKCVKGKNEFLFTLPLSKQTITFKLLTHRDEKAIVAEIEGVKKSGTQSSTSVTTRMNKSITSVDGDTDRQKIKDTVDSMLARDAMEFRKFAKEVNPDVDMSFDFECSNCGHSDRSEVVIDVNFFWPDARV
jgi:transcription elongation factor Elf1